jgi:hypothetical protein
VILSGLAAKKSGDMKKRSGGGSLEKSCFFSFNPGSKVHSNRGIPALWNFGVGF